MNVKITECEKHFIYDCDLNSPARHTTKNILVQHLHVTGYDNKNLDFMELLKLNSNSLTLPHHNIITTKTMINTNTNYTPTSSPDQQLPISHLEIKTTRIRNTNIDYAFIARTIAKFISICTDRRAKLLKSIKTNDYILPVIYS